ncbi:DUF2793 domain-containing protein [Croceicoccus hydrothermalis]|uniref:DUF2793 domain-containing protein n=1 Tax=Croceicoccus hydrothermalis TaxID=2867964 RepID=UPI001EFA694B|nr:DUF2793 domain-containing protein [Croceicoccus hydrothermalis]
MTAPVTFDDSTPSFALPMLYAAQAQKEYFVNEALSRIDALIQCVVEGIASSEPVNPQNGQNWIVANAASGAFHGQDNKIACRQQGQWLFAAPKPSMLVFDRTLGKQRRFDGEGFMRRKSNSRPEAPTSTPRPGPPSPRFAKHWSARAFSRAGKKLHRDGNEATDRWFCPVT